jgi:hypothetical protein
MTGDRRVSRRDFLRLRRTERGKVLDLSCRAMFMRCADAAIVSEPVADWEPWMGEPPAAIHRRSADEILQSFDRDLQDVQVLRLQEPEWLESIVGAERLQAAIAAFLSRGGVVESAESDPPG